MHYYAKTTDRQMYRFWEHNCMDPQSGQRSVLSVFAQYIVAQHRDHDTRDICSSRPHSALC